ncbi:MAG: hypothetical protein ACR2HR_04020 [Euzebya sp.]
MSARLGEDVPSGRTSFGVAAALAAELSTRRPVSLDSRAARILDPTVRLTPVGLSAEVLPAGDRAPLLLDTSMANALTTALDVVGDGDRIGVDRWPDADVQQAYRDALVRGGLAYLDRDQTGPARTVLELAWTTAPLDPAVRDAAVLFERRVEAEVGR